MIIEKSDRRINTVGLQIFLVGHPRISQKPSVFAVCIPQGFLRGPNLDARINNTTKLHLSSFSFDFLAALLFHIGPGVCRL